MKNSPMAAPAMGAMYCMGAESEAVAETMMVLSSTPWRERVSRMEATVEAF